MRPKDGRSDRTGACSPEWEPSRHPPRLSGAMNRLGLAAAAACAHAECRLKQRVNVHVNLSMALTEMSAKSLTVMLGGPTRRVGEHCTRWSRCYDCGYPRSHDWRYCTISCGSVSRSFRGRALRVWSLYRRPFNVVTTGMRNIAPTADEPRPIETSRISTLGIQIGGSKRPRL